MKPKLHPLIAGIFDAVAKTAVEKAEQREEAIKRASELPRVSQHRNDQTRVDRAAKKMIGARQLKKMRKVARREQSA